MRRYAVDAVAVAVIAANDSERPKISSRNRSATFGSEGPVIVLLLTAAASMRTGARPNRMMATARVRDGSGEGVAIMQETVRKNERKEVRDRGSGTL